MREIGLFATLFVVSCCVPISAQSLEGNKPGRASAFAFVLADVRANRKMHYKEEEWKWTRPLWQECKYSGFIFGSKMYVYSGNGKLIKTVPATWPTAAIIENYAEIGWVPLNSKMRENTDFGGSFVLRFDGNKWKQVGWDNSADGYGNSLQKSKVPPRVIKKLKRWMRQGSK